MAAKDPILLKIGQNIRKARVARAWSQEELAFKCGVHRTYVGSVERGEYNVTILTLRRITKTLRITIQDVISGVS